MNILKQVCVLLIVAAFVVNPVVACCDITKPAGNASEVEMVAGHDCDQMRAKTSIQHEEQNTSTGPDLHRMMNCEGCADCVSFGRLAQNAIELAIVSAGVDIETHTSVSEHRPAVEIVLHDNADPPEVGAYQHRTLVQDNIKLTI